MLIRGAYSSNIKERRDCSAALFDAEGQLVAQAEHIPVHLGAMPESVAAVMERDPRPGDVFVAQRPVLGGHPPARHHARLAGGARRRHARLRRHARPPLRRRRHAPGLDARRLARDLAGGSDHPAGAARPRGRVRRGRPGAGAGQRAHAVDPARRPARPDRRQPPGRDAHRRAGRAPRSRRRAGRLRGGPRLRRAAHARGAARGSRRHLPRRAARSRATARPTTTCRSRWP